MEQYKYQYLEYRTVSSPKQGTKITTLLSRIVFIEKNTLKALSETLLEEMKPVATGEKETRMSLISFGLSGF